MFVKYAYLEFLILILNTVRAPDDERRTARNMLSL
jgi:hypothetical protein